MAERHSQDTNLLDHLRDDETLHEMSVDELVLALRSVGLQWVRLDDELRGTKQFSLLRQTEDYSDTLDRIGNALQHKRDQLNEPPRRRRFHRR